MNVLCFAASLRTASWNRKLAAQAVEILRASPGVKVDAADFREFEMPVYDGDLEDRDGLPPGARRFVDRVLKAQAVVISTPEYNGGIPGSLKNALDWSSRAEEDVWSGRPLLLIGASPGALGAVRGLWHTRVPFEALGAFVYPEMFGLARAHQAFDPAGRLVDEKNQSRLASLIQDFTQFVTRGAQ